jgi:hypothetical protein
MIRRFWYDDWFDGFWNTNFTFGELVDTRKYDIINGEKVPRKDLKDRHLKAIDEKIKELEEEKKKLTG